MSSSINSVHGHGIESASTVVLFIRSREHNSQPPRQSLNAHSRRFPLPPKMQRATQRRDGHCCFLLFRAMIYSGDCATSVLASDERADGRTEGKATTTTMATAKQAWDFGPRQLKTACASQAQVQTLSHRGRCCRFWHILHE